MLARAVHGIGAAQAVQPAQDVRCAAGGDVVQVQRHDIPARHVGGLAAVTVEVTANKAPNVLQLVLL
ncbi:hypothetical protein GCM10025857_40120 [Alicyclobacillus contaminans]|nr:hypothetical protein GCM10025857_40120 [Alicyclobacillus contaminans]